MQPAGYRLLLLTNIFVRCFCYGAMLDAPCCRLVILAELITSYSAPTTINANHRLLGHMARLTNNYAILRILWLFEYYVIFLYVLRATTCHVFVFF